jgi:hypothetical protein
LSKLGRNLSRLVVNVPIVPDNEAERSTHRRWHCLPGAPVFMVKLITLLASLIFASLAHGAPASLESIDRLLADTKVEKLLDTMSTNVDQVMRRSMEASTQGQQLSPEQRRVIDATAAKFVQVMREEMTWDKMRPLYVQIYQESFTQEEIDGLIAFYESPAGVAFVEKMPFVMQKSMSIMQSRLAPMMEKMKAAMKEAIAEPKAAQ